MLKNFAKHFLQTAVILILCQASLASETDNFTKRDLKTDAREWLNAQMNAAIQKAVQEADPNVAYSVHKNLFKSLGGLFWAKIEKWAEDPKSPAEHVKFEESIFRDVGEVRGASAARKLFKFKDYYSPGIYRMGDTVFGADKLGHFLQLGYSMYLANGKKQNPQFKDVRPFHIRMADVISGDKKYRNEATTRGIELAYDYSLFEENGSWGMKGPMARSWADMAANVEGFKFWAELTGGPNPYVKRDANGRWIQARQFDWATYVSPAWDEAVNRTDYDPRFSAQVEKRIQEAIKKGGYTLPSEQVVFDKYGSQAGKIFNNQCSKAFGF